MTKSKFLDIINAKDAAKELRVFTSRTFLMNAFLVELEGLRNKLSEEEINIEDAQNRLLKFVDSQIDAIAYSFSELDEMSYIMTTVSELIEDIDS